MNFSIYSADRATHLRILVVTLIASIAIIGFSISARFNSIEPIDAMNIDRYQQVKIPGKAAPASHSPGRASASLMPLQVVTPAQRMGAIAPKSTLAGKRATYAADPIAYSSKLPLTL